MTTASQHPNRTLNRISLIAQALVLAGPLLAIPGAAHAQANHLANGQSTNANQAVNVIAEPGQPPSQFELVRPRLVPSLPAPNPRNTLCLSSPIGSAASVVTTHYPSYGGTEAAPFPEVHPVTFGQYSNRLNDFCPVSSTRVEEFRQAVIALTASEAFGGFDPLFRADLNQAVAGAPTIQIIDNLQVPGDDGALYTVFLPPGWTRLDNRHIILSGNGAGISNNARIYNNVFEPNGFDLFPVEAAALGFIVAVSNAGGTESQGIDTRTLNSVGEFFKYISQYGGNPLSVTTVGASRGGGTALVWAANPQNFEYDVQSVFALVPPTNMGSLVASSLATYPGLAEILELVTHDPDAWKDIEGTLLVVLEALTGVTSIKEANAVGPIGLATRLVGKRVVIAGGTHDAFIPLSHFLAFDRQLAKLGVDHLSIITLANGHEPSLGFELALEQHLVCLAFGQCVQPSNGRQFFIDRAPSVDDQTPLFEFLEEQGIEADPSLLPVAVQFPYRVGAGSVSDIEVCGPVGAVVELIMSDMETGKVGYKDRIIIGNSECKTVSTTLPGGTDITNTVYEWSLTIDGDDVSPYNTPTGHRGLSGCQAATTTVELAAPHPLTTLAFSPFMNWGLDQYSGSPCAF